MTLEIRNLSRRLALSEGALLQLAREVAEDGRLLSVDHMTNVQQRNLLTMLEFLAQPAVPVTRLQPVFAHASRENYCA